MADGSVHLPRETWPPDYVQVFAERQKRLIKLRSNVPGAFEYYRHRPIEFIEHWGVTFDPRNVADPNKLTFMPFIMFERQREFTEFLWLCITEQTDGLVEKARDMGATWICVAFSVWLWLFWEGAAIGWGSRKQEYVDRIGDPKTIFEKIRIFIRKLPKEFMPEGFDPNTDMPFMKITNPATGASITGEAGDNIGRGGRSLIYFKDESAHYERPELIEAALGDNTNVQIDISSVNGLGNVFYRKRKSGKIWGRGEPLSKDATNVFIMDWRDHPAKTQEWYDRRRAKSEREGLLHKFAQEVERNYAAAVTGVIIPLHWLQAIVDAHVKLGIPDAEAGPWGGALDVADNDGTGDANALVLRKGIVLKSADQWHERDVGVTTRRAIGACVGKGAMELQYDSIGVGASVKAEYNRLRDMERDPADTFIMPRGLQLVPWDAGRGPLYPKRRVIEDDPESPRNEDFYANIKAQGWWTLRARVERTFRALTEPGYTWNAEDLISISSEIPRAMLDQLLEELAQPTSGYSGRLRLLVNKAPEGTKSPNLGDAAMMAFWPVPAPQSAVVEVGVYGASA